MQLSLTSEELELLRWILQEDTRLSRSEALSLQIAVGNCLRDKLLVGRDLLRRTLSRNLQLGYDELEDLADSLRQRNKELTVEICGSQDPQSRSELERRAVVLQHLLEKVVEACAMV
jgi:hypothetical protein